MIPITTANKITSQKLATLQPAFRQRVKQWLTDCVNDGLVCPYIYEGLRTSARQNELYAIGRTVQRGKPKVTNAKAGQSMHQYGVAIDFVPLNPTKAADMFEADWSEKAYAPYHALAAKHSLRRLSWETPHLEDGTVPNWQAAAKLYPCA